MDRLKALPTEIHRAVESRKLESQRATSLHSRAAKLLSERGKLEYIQPGNPNTYKVFSVTEVVDGINFRVWAYADEKESVPTEEDVGPIRVTFEPESSGSMYGNQVAELSYRGTNSKFSSIISCEQKLMDDSHLLQSFAEELDLTELIFSEVFGA